MIRAATPDDLPQIIALARASESAAQWDASHYESIFENHTDNASLQQSHRIALVLEDAGTVKGFVIARVAADQCELENIAVEAASRRSGFATQLLKALFDWAAKSRVQSVFLEVRASNVAARRLYESAGFRHTGRRPGYYQNPEEEAILYSRQIDAVSLKNH